MKPLARPLFSVSLLVMLPLSSALADDVWLLKGQSDAAPVSNLKGSSVDDTAVVPVFHGLFCGCCRRARCCCAPVCCDPYVVSCCPPAAPVGYGSAAPAYSQSQDFGYYAPRYSAP